MNLMCLAVLLYENYFSVFIYKFSLIFKGTWTRLVKFVYILISFYPKLLYISSMKSYLNRTTILKLILHGIELHAAFEQRGTLNFDSKPWSYLSFPIKLHCGKRKITLN